MARQCREAERERLDLTLVELTHGVPLQRLQLKNSLGYIWGYTQEWDVSGFNDLKGSRLPAIRASREVW